MELGEFSEIIRVALAVGMFSLGAYYDWKTGMISERLWLVFALAAAIVYLINPPAYGTVWIMGLGALTALACRLAGLYATGDFEALLALSFILPVFDGVPTVMPVLLGSALFSLFAVLAANPAINLYRSKSKKLFDDLCDSAPRKFLAFFLVHKYRPGEIHAYCGERNSNGRRTLWFMSARNPRHVDEIPIRAGTYVGITVPLLIPLTVSLISLVAALVFSDLANWNP